VGSKQFTEQLILGNLITINLQAGGYDVEYAPLSGTSAAHDALLAGKIDLYAEYTGTGYQVLLGLDYEPGMTAEHIYDVVSEAYQEQWNLTWLEPSVFNNTYCLAMLDYRANELGIATLSDLQEGSRALIFGATREFIDRSDGLPGLVTMYGEFSFSEVHAIDPGLKYTALQEGEIDVVTCFGTDGQISGMGLRVLEDDLHYWPPYHVAPVIRNEVVETDPHIAEVLNQLMQLLDAETMSALNWEVDHNGRDPADVANDFIVERSGVLF
jgi:osmoprotectant transport system substrate-binding protein